MSINKPPRRRTANKLAGVSLQAQQGFRNLTIDVRNAFRHMKVGQLWYLAMHCLGFVGYALVSVIVAVILWVVFFCAVMVGGELNRSELMQPVGSYGMHFNIFRYLATFIQWLFMACYRLFAGFMGWGAKDATPTQVPWRILGSIGRQIKPNRTTQFFGYLTLTALVFLAVDYVLFLTSTGGDVL